MKLLIQGFNQLLQCSTFVLKVNWGPWQQLWVNTPISCPWKHLRLASWSRLPT